MDNEQLFDENGNLPPGIHEYEWRKFHNLFGWNSHRRSLLSGMLRGLQHLKSIGCQRAYVDGSFVTSKPIPGDYDCCWERAAMNLQALDPVFLDFSIGRMRQKAIYFGEWFPADLPADPAGSAFTEFFQTDRSGNRKGLVAINLGGVL